MVRWTTILVLLLPIVAKLLKIIAKHRGIHEEIKINERKIYVCEFNRGNERKRAAIIKSLRAIVPLRDKRWFIFKKIIINDGKENLTRKLL